MLETLEPVQEELPASTTELTPKDLIGLAAEYIDVHGKCNDVFGESDGSVCTLGALYAVKHNCANLYEAMSTPEHIASWSSPWSDKDVFEAAKVIADHAGLEHDAHFPPTNAVAYNWSDKNTKDTVVQTLREIAAA